MNKKGQVLVTFVLLLPLLIMFLGLIIDIGNSYSLKKKNEIVLENVILKFVKYKKIDNELDSTETVNDELIEFDSNEIIEPDINLIEKNIKENIKNYDDLKVFVDNNILNIKLEFTYKSIFTNIFNIGLNKITISKSVDL